MTPTSSPSLTPQSAAEELIVAQALAYYRDMKAVAKNAPCGQFLNYAETVALSKERELIRQSLETIAQEEINDSEKLFDRYSVKKRKSARNAKRKNGIGWRCYLNKLVIFWHSEHCKLV